MPEISPSDFLLVDFSVRVKGGEVVETTDESQAKAAGIYKEGMPYGSALVLLADRDLVKGFKKALLEANVGEKKNASIPSDEAFGTRNEELVRIIPAQKFKDSGFDPEPGMIVTVDEMRGRVQSISGGRVRVDFNHELAGRDLEYAFEVASILKDGQSKLNALVEDFLEIKGAVTINGDTAQVMVSSEVLGKNRDYLGKKVAIIEKALLYVPEIKKLLWTEEFVTKQV